MRHSLVSLVRLRQFQRVSYFAGDERLGGRGYTKLLMSHLKVQAGQLGVGANRLCVRLRSNRCVTDFASHSLSLSLSLHELGV